MVVRSFAKPEEEIKRLKLTLVKLGAVDCIATIAMGLGLFTMFADSPESLLPILGKSGVGIGLLVCGALVATIVMPKILLIARKIRKLELSLADSG